jgi:hypothetical protein
MLGVPDAFDQLMGQASNDEVSTAGADWLKNMGLWDEDLGLGAMRIRYERFKGIKFGVVPEN